MSRSGLSHCAKEASDRTKHAPLRTVISAGDFLLASTLVRVEESELTDNKALAGVPLLLVAVPSHGTSEFFPPPDRAFLSGARSD